MDTLLDTLEQVEVVHSLLDTYQKLQEDILDCTEDDLVLLQEDKLLEALEAEGTREVEEMVLGYNWATVG